MGSILLPINELSFGARNVEENFRRLEDLAEAPRQAAAEMGVFEGSGSQTGIGSSYVKIDQFDSVQGENGIEADLVNQQFLIPLKGLYSMSGYFSFSGSNNRSYFFSPFVTLAGEPPAQAIRQVEQRVASNDVQTVSFSYLLPMIEDGAIVDFRVKASSGGGFFSLSEASVHILFQSEIQ